VNKSLPRGPCIALQLVLFAWTPSGVLRAGAGGDISGTVTDSSGAVVPHAKVSAVNAATGVTTGAATDSQGFYSLVGLPIGQYDVLVELAGFRPYRRTGIVIDANSEIRVDATLVVGDAGGSVTVSESEIHVETTSTQSGEVITGAKMTAVPLNGRSYTDLLSLQAGVVPLSTIVPGAIADVGASAFSPSGNLNPGNISVSGQREDANGFMVNGADVEERVNMGTAIIPNLDSIAEFRMLTHNFDAEYGNYSGGIINVITKSGGNQVHGDAFEFLRNTDLDARNFFSPTRGAFRQSQFGGTVGGPIKRNKVFFFADYQGTRLTQGVDTGLIQVPSLNDRAGNLSDLARQLTGSVSGPYVAFLLRRKLGYQISANERYYTPGCVSDTQCVFPNAVIPPAAWSAPALQLLQYIPLPNVGTNYASTSAFNEVLGDDKGSLRIDGNSKRWGTLSAYYFIDNYSLNNPYPTQQGGANVPGFSAASLGLSQLILLSSTRTFGSTAVNEFHASYSRDANQLGNPVGGVGVSLASQGFKTGADTMGIVPLDPAIEGVENVQFNNYTIGETTTGLAQVNNTFQVLDTFSKVLEKHTIKFGGEVEDAQVNARPDVQYNGTFSFFGTETGNDFADFLLGFPSSYTQGDAQAFYNRDEYASLYLQDSWRVRPRLTLNYGMRWDPIAPWYEKYNQVQTLVPGEQSVVFPTAPAGLVFPGDPGVPRTLAPTRWNNLSPRLGLAYSPSAKDGLPGWLLGEDKTSIRAGAGRFFSAIEGVTAGVMAANAPYGTTYTSPVPPLFATPFVDASDDETEGQRFPLTFPPLNSSRNNPDPNINWSQYEPITGVPGYLPTNRSPYTDEYDLTIQRQFGKSTLLSVAYVGSESHHLLALVEANPGNPALCLSLSKPSEVVPDTPTCGPFGESGVYFNKAGQLINGTRAPFGPAFGANTYQAAWGNSNYNALETTLRHRTKRTDVMAAYTWSKSLDNSSSLAEQLNPTNYRLTYGPSSFDIKHNFVVSYRYELPLDLLLGKKNRFTQGWIVSGITRLSTGFPVTLFNNSDNSLLGTQPDGVNDYGVDEPNVVPGPLNLNQNPRNGKPYFNTALFSLQPLGQPGNAARRMFYGPGVENFDMALLKTVPVSESSSFQLRLEAFNVLNHAQFDGPGSVNGTITSTAFGYVVSAAPPRLMQLALKYVF
jgi:hypothetical protein